MKTGSKSPLLPSVIKTETSNAKKVKARAVVTSVPKPQRLKMWVENEHEDGVCISIQNMDSKKTTKLPLTFEQFGAFCSGFEVVATPTKPQ
jgi:hypothetical protein